MLVLVTTSWHAALRGNFAQHSCADGMHTDSIHHALSSRLHTPSPVQDRHIRSVAVKINQDDRQTAWVTITDHTDAGEPVDHLFSFSWTHDLIVDNLTDSVIRAYLYTITGGEPADRELAPHLGMDYRLFTI